MRSVGPLLVLKEWGGVGRLPARGLRAEQHGIGVTLDQRVLTSHNVLLVCPNELSETSSKHT